MDTPQLDLHRASREYAHLELTADVDLTSAVLAVALDDGDFTPWSWTGPAVQVTTTAAADPDALVWESSDFAPTPDTATPPAGPEWVRTARALLAGPDADPDGATLVVPLGRHELTVRLTGIEPEQPATFAGYLDVQ